MNHLTESRKIQEAATEKCPCSSIDCPTCSADIEFDVEARTRWPLETRALEVAVRALENMDCDCDWTGNFHTTWCNKFESDQALKQIKEILGEK